MIADTVISVCALGLTLWGIQATRRHNRLSARPHIAGSQNIDWGDEGCTYTYDICNHGLGPARLKQFTLILDGETFACPPGKQVLEEFFQKKLSGKLEYQLLTSGIPSKEYSILASQCYRITKILIPGATRADIPRIAAAFKGSELRVEYESFYEEKFAFDTRN